MDDIGEDTIADTVDGERSAIVEATVITETGFRNDSRIVTVTHEGSWVILAQGIRMTGESPSLEIPVVDDVTFDTEEDSARVYFADSLQADSVTAKAGNAFSSRSSETPEIIEYFDLSLNPEGDAVIVTVTVDEKSRPVHRERYPPSDRIVESISFDKDPETGLYDAKARITFTGNGGDGRLRVESTVQGSEMTFDSVSNASHSVIGIAPEGDEIVVTLTADGSSDVIHRERYHP